MRKMFLSFAFALGVFVSASHDGIAQDIVVEELEYYFPHQ